MLMAFCLGKEGSQDCYPCDPSFPKQNAINMRTYLAECGLGLA